MIKIQVTEEHIRKGCRADGGNCPVFLAMRDAGIPVTWMFSLDWTTHPDRSNAPFWGQRPLPTVASNFVRDYDHNDPVSPIEFEVEYTPDETVFL